MGIGKRLQVLGLCGALVAGLLASAPATEAAARPAHTVTYDKYSLKLDGKRLYVWSGEFHYWRLPSPDLWRDVLQKMKAAGFNAVSIYFDWGFHSPKQGVYDFTGIRDVGKLLDIARQTGIYVIARPGPYINAETDSGGFPGWLTKQAGLARTSAPDYVAAAKEWFTAINAVLKRHQVTDGGGPIVLYQVENEYSGTVLDAGYMQALVDKARADGITVPLFHNDVWPGGKWAPGKPGAPDLYAFDGYPNLFDCRNPQVWKPAPDFRWTRPVSPDTPMFVAEFQGGSFDPWGGPGYDKCRELTGASFENVFYKNNISSGLTLQNFYMTYGGTSWGWLPDPNVVYTSYDYGAAISEARQLGPKYDEQKRIGYFTQAVEPLTKTDPGPDITGANPAVTLKTQSNPDTRTQFVLAQHKDTTSTTHERTTFPLTVPDGTYPAVPQQGALDVDGREAKLLVAGYDLGGQRLVYSTSELMTHARIGGRDTAVLYGGAGQDGETVLRYPSEPKVTVLDGSVDHAWDAARGDLRLDYRHGGLARVRVEGGGRAPLELLIADTAASAAFWKQDTAAGPVLERGSDLVRTATATGPLLALTGDTARAGDLEVWAPPSIRWVTWNGRPLPVTRTAAGTLRGRLNGPAPVTLPALTGWRTQYETPERQPGFDDTRWTAADHRTTNNPTKPPAGQPVLNADDYGFHHGDVWYRGHFSSTGAETAVTLNGITGNPGVYSAWLNGTYLGSSGSGTHEFAIPAGTLKPDNVLSVLLENMGHNEDWDVNDAHKQPRGLMSAAFTGGTPDVHWKIQGTQGGEDLADPVRGPFNNGGLYGERAGWSLPGFPDRGWQRTSLPAARTEPGVTWYRTEFSLHLPAGQDTAVGLRIDDDPALVYRAQIFVNGWNLGRYLNNVGPQHVFSLPTGILRPDGRNTIAIASWGDGSRGLGQVGLVDLGTHRGGVPVADVPSPAYRGH
ncbi:beta-galactosidase [Amycolatopsis vastitatis]|uniref:Beta-galactosidase n=1 Tax=Amycolatopsis vastitatis TaxID=1905142 RepID=A0A229SX89_9PSEU|nr:beta-galactosidase [Amycolatopsis vastitatis]OXM63281.1 beta-galactosidase [Amycolatopsis vastitatis]